MSNILEIIYFNIKINQAELTILTCGVIRCRKNMAIALLVKSDFKFHQICIQMDENDIQRMRTIVKVRPPSEKEV